MDDRHSSGITGILALIALAALWWIGRHYFPEFDENHRGVGAVACSFCGIYTVSFPLQTQGDTGNEEGGETESGLFSKQVGSDGAAQTDHGDEGYQG